MNRLLLMVGFFVLSVIGAAIALYCFVPQSRPRQASNINFTLDPSMVGSVIWVNDSGKPCKLTFNGGIKTLTMNLNLQLPEGPEPQGPYMTNAPFTINKVTLERDGKKTEIDLNITVEPKATCEIHVGPDDKISAVDKNPGRN